MGGKKNHVSFTVFVCSRCYFRTTQFCFSKINGDGRKQESRESENS